MWLVFVLMCLMYFCADVSFYVSSADPVDVSYNVADVYIVIFFVLVFMLIPINVVNDIAMAVLLSQLKFCCFVCFLSLLISHWCCWWCCSWCSGIVVDVLVLFIFLLHTQDGCGGETGRGRLSAHWERNPWYCRSWLEEGVSLSSLHPQSMPAYTLGHSSCWIFIWVDCGILCGL